MADCSYCGLKTAMYHQGAPICLECAKAKGREKVTQSDDCPDVALASSNGRPTKPSRKQREDGSAASASPNVLN